MSEEGTITRHRRFAQLPDELVTDTRLSSHAVRVWARLDKYAGKNGRAFPSRQTLADDLGLSVTTVKRALIELVETGWITRNKAAGNIWNTHLSDSTRVTGDPS
jgi:DNA-binding FadR family transcriptional regulator